MASSECRTVQQRLSAYYDGELSAGLAADVARHIEACDECAAELSSFESLSSDFAHTPLPAIPPHLWQRIESELKPGVEPIPEPVTLPRRLADSISRSPYIAGFVSMAASVLLLLGFGLWYGGEEPAAAVALHSHHDEHDVSHQHLAEFTGVMNDYLQKLHRDPDEAEQMLLAKYNGKRVDADDAVRLVGYRPIISGGLPDGYSLASTSVLKMPCCTCVKAVCRRNDGSTLVLFEHDDQQAAWFGDRPSNMATCGNKECCLIDLDHSIAATWKQGSRNVTAVGVRDQAEVATLVEWLEKKAGRAGVGIEGV